MKLTQERLKQIIIEELSGMSEQEEVVPAEDEKKADPTKSISQLKKDLIDASRNIQNVKGLDPKEIQLISGVLAVVMQLASESSAGTILQRIYDVLQKQVG